MNTLDWLRGRGFRIPSRPHVPDSLRGWNIEIGGLFRCYAPLSALLVDCPTGRSAYIHHRGVLRTPPNPSTVRGIVYHSLLLPASLAAKKGPRTRLDELLRRVAEKEKLPKEMMPEMKKVNRVFGLLYRFFSSVPEGIDVETEREIEGSVIGATGLRADVVLHPPFVVLDMKTNFFRKRIVQYYRQITAYAIALESETDEPVDYGGILEVNPMGLRLFVFPVDALRRRDVLTLIGQKVHVCSSLEPRDPGYPEDVYCRGCSLREVCRGEAEGNGQG